MRPLVVVEPNPIANDSAGVLQGLESLTMRALIFECTDHQLHHAVFSGPRVMNTCCRL